ncbi:exodeoxyribonuclease VII small subunit [Alicyclobacillus macrosporangiidus]|uniref:exodeoxyribonuclease VII small subunit n=1 Tax=Alicyclobacillus macrosporangiidus TaxID=392015 RepID=UPI0026EDD796|nr:exodeoxyribonuclease VII small subunit [Alicyclobacillus macrosporangiidus]
MSQDTELQGVTPKETDNSGLTFELAMRRLEETVRLLETGELTLSDSIERYKEAMQLVQFCRTQLDRAELEIERLLAEDGSTEKEENGA